MGSKGSAGEDSAGADKLRSDEDGPGGQEDTRWENDWEKQKAGNWLFNLIQ